MKLRVGCKLEYISNHHTPLITILRLRKELSQFIENETFILEPLLPMSEYVDFYGNYCQRLETNQGKLVIDTSAIVVTSDTVEQNPEANFTLIQDLPDHTLIYLLPSRFCESDKLNNKAFEIIIGQITGYQMVEAIRTWVNKNIKYEYNKSTSTTSALDTLESKHGVCRDLSHLAIALCRSVNIPARIVVGYLHNLKPMDLHAWFEAYLDGQWYTFDATQSQTTGGRVVLAYGRDAADVATATYFGDMKLTNMYVFVEQIA
ncbi:MAG: transglutaminase family protein [Bacteroidota bacterium]